MQDLAPRCTLHLGNILWNRLCHRSTGSDQCRPAQGAPGVVVQLWVLLVGAVCHWLRFYYTYRVSYQLICRGRGRDLATVLGGCSFESLPD